MLNNLFSKKNQNSEVQNTDTFTDEWMGDKNENGKMAIDVYQTDQDIIVKSFLPGVHQEDLKISLHNDLLTIKGFCHENELIPEADYLYKECYFGEFSRSLILPHEVDSKNIDASLEDGVLTIKLPKLNNNENQIKIKN